MFRKMRRAPQALSEDEISDVLTRENRGVLSLIGDEGYPYGVPINHYYDEKAGKLYFHGAKIGHRVEAMKRNPKASYCVISECEKPDGEWAYYVKSVIAFGRTELVEDTDEIIRVCRLLCAKFPCPQEYIEKEIAEDTKNTLCFALKIEHLTGKLVHEN